jgi:hypothetical protein
MRSWVGLFLVFICLVFAGCCCGGYQQPCYNYGATPMCPPGCAPVVGQMPQPAYPPPGAGASFSTPACSSCEGTVVPSQPRMLTASPQWRSSL